MNVICRDSILIVAMQCNVLLIVDGGLLDLRLSSLVVLPFYFKHSGIARAQHYNVLLDRYLFLHYAFNLIYLKYYFFYFHGVLQLSNEVLARGLVCTGPRLILYIRAITQLLLQMQA